MSVAMDALVELMNRTDKVHIVGPGTDLTFSIQGIPAIKCDGRCQAVDASNKVVSGLFVAGADADLFTSPYYAAGSANGFAVGSGLIAGEAAAEAALG